MLQPPRKKNANLFRSEEILISIVQGLVIAGGVLFLYHVYTRQGAPLTEVRNIVFTTLIFSNIFLTYANRSFEQTIVKTSRYPNNLALPVLLLSLVFLALLQVVPAVQHLFGLSGLGAPAFAVCFFTALICVGWFEMYKADLHLVLPAAMPEGRQASG